MSQLADLENICPLGYNHFQKTVLHAIASPSTYLFNFDGGVPIVYFRTDIDIPQIEIGQKIMTLEITSEVVW